MDRVSVATVKMFLFQIFMNLHVLDLPESEKHILGNIVFPYVCERDNSKVKRDRRIKFDV
ncbi:hypothetical protein AVEN_132478-1, partial [Araneus ventricosus]